MLQVQRGVGKNGDRTGGGDSSHDCCERGGLQFCHEGLIRPTQSGRRCTSTDEVGGEVSQSQRSELYWSENKRPEMYL